MSAVTAYSCCCEGGGQWPSEYYVFQPCPESPCCDLECGGAPEVKWCPAYAAAQGLLVPIVPNPALCIYMDYGCCKYVLTNVVPNPGGVCPTGGGIWNVGTFAGTRTISGEEACCDAQLIPVPDTCVWNGVYPLLVPEPSFCFAYVFEPYTNADQWGIVPSKPVTVTSVLTYCYATFGAQSFAACDNCPPIDHYQAKVSHSQEIGWCIPAAVPADCPNQRNYVQVEYLTCAECNPCGACCGGSDPCEGVDPNADFCEDPAASFTIKTCYSVNPCLDANDDPIWFEQDVLTVTYDFCATAIDPDAPDALAQLTALFAGGGTVVPYYFDNSAWTDPNTGIRINLCPGGGFGPPSVLVYSGDAKDIANAINSLRVNFPWLRADASEVWGECFWFGIRQTCDNCPEDPPGTRPAYGGGGQDADQLVFDRIEIIDSTRFRAIFRGRSKKHYVCAAQTLESIHSVAVGCSYNDTDVVNLAVSATGSVEEGFALHCLSPAEYACGDRYTMQQIEQDYCSTTICTPDFPGGQTVIGCEAVTGYPLYDVVVDGITVLEGWTSLCGGGTPSMPAIPQFRCRSYPWQYQVTPCGQIPPGGTCEPGVYQSAAAYCETDATPITVT